MDLKKYKHEVVINLNEQDDNAILYCSHPAWMKRMDNLARKYPDVCHITRRSDVSKSYEFPKHLVKIRRPKD